MNRGQNSRVPRCVLVLLLSVGLVAFICLFDYVAGPEFSFSVLYLLPISLTSWYGGWRSGITLALLSLVAWLVADIHSASMYHFRSSVRYWNAGSLAAFYLVTSISLSALRRALDRERELSHIDFLTKVGNLRGFQDLAEMEKNRARRYHRPLTLAYLDIDDFKRVNDQHGHPAGDALLVQLGQLLRQNLRETDHVARIGGDEFAVLLPETDQQSGEFVLAKLLHALRNLGQQWQITFSIGAVTFMSEPQSLEQMVSTADRLMYSAKNKGKNQIAHLVVAE